ncbi:hypothetical protein [Clostridium saccharobutylicum]|uniref:Immunity protein 30 domain-containing protein n=1 Tax=Clostridium saccharobutylicum DSM 13864 TaxID=1345695 RepID=U5MMU0_CLOSA|nr:hypothetical protein [Clostridium saccharobutylicum]AGX41848.1 hypothetical protein CLSA_c08350 [Clostridium saccharobutylicum DSM 13864]AQR89123.1 hypothetical protein CLOSC_08190 [Clostridium saccharobutylicum]AQR99024.1 hypothetical protein CSACC_08260 [Clostridium saccharobutylicum]AQS13012.1 hypothetical protein CLOSACC_08260 [Clostridium saccharobutylicum]MBA2903868.1 hypothetical protein [Clostridium saccharobutylicum]
MEKGLNELISKLEKSVSSDNFSDIAYDVIEEIEEREDAFEAIQSILIIMEKNKSVDFGKPGPLVHFVEKFYKNGYEEKLVDSLKRFPTQHTVWMLNRIINGCQGDRKMYFIKVLDDVIAFPNLDSEVLSLANHFKSLHQ